jgi:hypothetical protein
MMDVAEPSPGPQMARARCAAAYFPAPGSPQLILCDPTMGVTGPDVQAALGNWLDGGA